MSLDVFGVEMEYHVPGERLDHRARTLAHAQIRRAAQVPHQLEAHTPPACSASSPRSVASSPTIATPRQAPPGANFRDQAIASSIARLSEPWQLAWTSTARARPRYSCNARNFSFGESGGV